MKQFYDYIRIYKPTAIRQIKNISLLIVIACIVTTVIILAAPIQKDPVPSSGASGGSYDKKMENEQAKKNYILRRFISYYPVKRASY